MIRVTLSEVRRLVRCVENLARMTATKPETWTVEFAGDAATATGENGAQVLISRPRRLVDAPPLPCPADLLEKCGLTWAPRRQDAYRAAENGATRALDLLLVRDAIGLAKAKEREARRARRQADEGR